MKGSGAGCAFALVLLTAGLATGDVFEAGGDRLLSMQNDDGGWDWPLSDEDLAISNAPNVFAPTAMGLVQAYRRTGDPNQLASLRAAGAYLLQKKPQQITPEDGYLAVALDEVFDVNEHTQFVKAHFYDALAASTYDYFGDESVFVDTASYVALVRLGREDQGLANLAAVDLGMGLYAAVLMKADPSAWIAGVKAEIDQLDGELPFDVLGLGAALFGLASAGEDFDPAFGAHADASSLADLAGILAGYQLSTGGFTWNSRNMDEEVGNETVQETSVAMLALGRFDPNAYNDCVADAAAYLQSVQLPSGGWEDFIDGGEHNEVTGEALWAIGQMPEPKEQ